LDRKVDRALSSSNPRSPYNENDEVRYQQSIKLKKNNSNQVESRSRIRDDRLLVGDLPVKANLESPSVYQQKIESELTPDYPAKESF
jgi:hypothetical protein